MRKNDAAPAVSETNSLLRLLVRYAPNVANREFAELKQIIKKQGLLEKQPVYYTIRIFSLVAMLALGVAFFIVVHNFYFQILDVLYLAFVFAQVGLLGHEAGHRQMFHRSWKHDLVGLLGGNFMIGMSYSWWMGKHNSHHSHPNQVDMDPDIEIPFPEFTGKEDLQSMSKFRQFLVKHQRIIFLPALMTVSLGLQISSIDFLLHNKPKYYVIEWLLIIAHYISYLALFFACANPWQAMIFIVLHQALTGLYLGSVFAPNHKGMAVLDKESNIGFLHRQIITARNIYAHPLTDFWYGGLNYQIEHHLFPSMPRNKLKQAQQIVKAFCQAHEIPYHETSFLQSYKEILTHLHEIGVPLRRTRTV